MTRQSTDRDEAGRPLWQLRTQSLEFGIWPRVMGIVNVTPDSFSDGGKFVETSAAIEHALKLVEDGADILDIGGESTRPYSKSVSEQEELDRVIPVIQELANRTAVPISVDTSKSSVAREAIAAGAEIINDVTGLEGDPRMVGVAVDSQAGICAMHMQGSPADMQDDPTYDDVTQEIFEYLRLRNEHLIEAGIAPNRICLDPGIGFGKTHEHNLTLINGCERFLGLGCPILVGHSRKGFIGKAIGDKEADRDAGTLAVSLQLAQKGIHVLRVHNVKATVDGLKLLNAIENRADYQ